MYRISIISYFFTMSSFIEINPMINNRTLESKIITMFTDNIVKDLKEYGVDLFKMFASKSFSYGPVYDDEEQSFIVKFCVELNEDDIQRIIILLEKHYHHVEEQKFMVIRGSYRIERYASDHLVYDVADYDVEEEITEFSEVCKDISDMITMLRKHNKNLHQATEDQNTWKTYLETKQKSQEMNETIAYIQSKLHEISELQNQLKKEKIIDFMAQKRLEDRYQFWNNSLTLALKKNIEYQNLMNELQNQDQEFFNVKQCLEILELSD